MEEAEKNYLILQHILLQYVANDFPSKLTDIKAVLIQLEYFTVYEKTFYVSKLLQSIKDDTYWQELEMALESEDISSGTISILKNYKQWI